jgi:hypothetical protein
MEPSNYYRHLDDHAESQPNTAPPVQWVCSFCAMGSLQNEAAFWRHMTTIHKDLIDDEEKTKPETEHQAWRKRVKSEAFSIGSNRM